MDKKHEIYKKLPVIFGGASIGMCALAVAFAELFLPIRLVVVTFFIGVVCTLAGLMSAGMKRGESEEDRRYCYPGVMICLIMLVLELLTIGGFMLMTAFFEELFHTDITYF